jgi:glycosyltransferase involved in cell wall biosynthesis
MAPSSLPTISITTPSYNQADYLGATLSAVIRQRGDLHEYFVFDGGSTDGSKTLIESRAKDIDFWVSEKDAGQSDAIAKGFERSTGDILFWLNSDDVILPGALRRVKTAFAEHPEWDVLTGWSVFLDERDTITRVNPIPGESRGWAGTGVLHVCQQTCYFRRELYERVGGLDRNLHCAMDTDLWLKFFSANARWGHIPELLGGFRQHSLMKGRTWDKRYEAERRIVQDRHPWFPAYGNRWSPAAWAYRVSQLPRFFSPKLRALQRLVGTSLDSLQLG